MNYLLDISLFNSINYNFNSYVFDILKYLGNNLFISDKTNKDIIDYLSDYTSNIYSDLIDYYNNLNDKNEFEGAKYYITKNLSLYEKFLSDNNINITSDIYDVINSNNYHNIILNSSILLNKEFDKNVILKLIDNRLKTYHFDIRDYYFSNYNINYIVSDGIYNIYKYTILRYRLNIDIEFEYEGIDDDLISNITSSIDDNCYLILENDNIISFDLNLELKDV